MYEILVLSSGITADLLVSSFNFKSPIKSGILDSLLVILLVDFKNLRPPAFLISAKKDFCWFSGFTEFVGFSCKGGGGGGSDLIVELNKACISRVGGWVGADCCEGSEWIGGIIGLVTFFSDELKFTVKTTLSFILKIYRD